jgi:Protein of unknown function (DUF732)
MNTRAALAAIAVGAAGLVVGVGIAKGDTEDQGGFIAALDRAGFTNIQVGEALQVGESVCRLMRSGMSQHAVIVGLENPPHPIPATTAIDFVVDAHVYLCEDVPSWGGTNSTSAGLG